MSGPQLGWVDGLGEAVRTALSDWLSKNGPSSVKGEEAQAFGRTATETLLGIAAKLTTTVPRCAMTEEQFLKRARRAFRAARG